MADRRSIPARGAVAPAQTLTHKHGRNYCKDCCQTGHSASIRDLSPVHAGCYSVINSLCTKNCGQPHPRGIKIPGRSRISRLVMPINYCLNTKTSCFGFSDLGHNISAALYGELGQRWRPGEMMRTTFLLKVSLGIVCYSGVRSRRLKSLASRTELCNKISLVKRFL